MAQTVKVDMNCDSPLWSKRHAQLVQTIFKLQDCKEIHDIVEIKGMTSV